MRRALAPLVTFMLVLGPAIPSHAAFIDFGGGLIYDDVLNITWLQDANYVQTSGYDADGLMSFDEANVWAANLVVGGTDGWRLPTFDPDNPRPTVATSANEIGSLLMDLTDGGFDLHTSYDADGNLVTPDITPFFNLPHLLSWQNSEAYWTGLAGGPGLAWEYWMDCG